MADLHLTTKPSVMLCRFLLLPNEVAHEVAQELRSVAVAVFGRCGDDERDGLKEGCPMEQIKSAWTKARKRAGLGNITIVGKGDDAKEVFTPNFRWHDLRHTWAKWHVQSGTPLEVLQKLGGWASYSMVLRYAHFAPDYLASYANNAKPYKPMTKTMTGTD